MQLTVLLHDGEDLDDDLGGRSDHDLSLSSSLSVDDVVLVRQHVFSLCLSLESASLVH